MKARGGPILAVVDAIDEDVVQQCDLVLPIPAVGEHLLPLLMSLPMQLIAYYVADHRGTDIDQPRNLAKAVTVE